MSDLRRVLVVEGDPPEVIEQAGAAGAPPSGLHFGAVLRELDPSLEIEIVTPSFPDFDAREASFEGVVGVALTGASVPWSADAREAAPHRQFLNRVFDHDVPVYGSCWGLQVATVVLGGSIGACARGPEFGIARNLTLTEAGRRHPLYAGKPTAFDAVAMHGDEVDRPPEGAVILAGNAHSTVQAFAYEQGMINFWGAQYSPELGLDAIAHALSRPDQPRYLAPEIAEDPAVAAQIAEDFLAMEMDPEAEAALTWRYGITEDTAFFDKRSIEIGNWVAQLGGG